MVAAASYLVVEDNPPLARSLSRFLGRFAPVHVTHTLAEARVAIKELDSIAGLVLDVKLPDGSGLDFLEEIRLLGLEAPALILTGLNDPSIPRRAQLHRALFLPKPPGPENLTSFVEWARRTLRQPERQLEEAVDRVSESFGLSRRERQVVLLAAQGLDRYEIGSQLGVEASTLKTLVRRLLRKVGVVNLQDLVSDIHRNLFREAQ